MPVNVNHNFIRPSLSATGRLQCPVADRGEHGKGEHSLSVGAVDVATKAIFSHSHESQDLGKSLFVSKRGGT